MELYSTAKLANSAVTDAKMSSSKLSVGHCYYGAVYWIHWSCL